MAAPLSVAAPAEGVRDLSLGYNLPALAQYRGTLVYFDRESETLPREKLRALQFGKLQNMLAEIHGRNAFYTRKLDEAGVAPGDINSLDDLPLLPFTRKSELVEAQQADGFTANLTYPLSAYTRFHQTSGTTGKPLRVFDTRSSWDWWARCWGHVFAAAGVTAEDRVFCAFSFGPFIGFWAAVDGASKIGALFIPGGGRSSMERLELMRETGCTVLCCTPSYALHLIEQARENDFDLGSLRIRTTIHAGEPGANIPEIKRRIESGWGARCFDHSGASEVGAFGFEASERRNGLYVLETEFIAEVIDTDTGQPVKPGEKGELVLTNLGRWGYPLIRYRTGDMVHAAAGLNDERHFMFLEGGIIGRADDMTTVRGVNIYPSAIDNFVRKHEAILEYRATVNKREQMDELTIQIEVSLEADAASIRDDLLEDMKATLGLRPNVEVVEAGSLPRFEMKAKRFFVLK